MFPPWSRKIRLHGFPPNHSEVRKVHMSHLGYEGADQYGNNAQEVWPRLCASLWPCHHPMHCISPWNHLYRLLIARLEKEKKRKKPCCTLVDGTQWQATEARDKNQNWAFLRLYCHIRDMNHSVSCVSVNSLSASWALDEMVLCQSSFGEILFGEREVSFRKVSGHQARKTILNGSCKGAYSPSLFSQFSRDSFAVW